MTNETTFVSTGTKFYKSWGNLTDLSWSVSKYGFLVETSTRFVGAASPPPIVISILL